MAKKAKSVTVSETENFRLEADSIGTKQVPVDALYGVQSLRAKENFPITGERMNPVFIRSMAQLKKACAIANMKAKELTPEQAEVIIAACDKIIAGEYLDEFIVDPIQGSAGTSMNMNANEVIANIAIVSMGGKPGQYDMIHPNDHVNRGQSTNDIIPSAGKITTLFLLDRLDKSLATLEKELLKKAKQFDGILKMGRTQLQDAVPMRLGQEFNAYATAVARGRQRIRKASEEMTALNMGATAIGTAINANPKYFNTVVKEISKVTGKKFTQAEDLIDGTMNIESFAAVSGAVRDTAVALSKMSNDLRLLSSGPRTGIGEINLPAMQNGSSIMPGKVNPVIPEVVNQAAFRVIGNDVTIAMAAEGGQMELNAFEPITFYSLFQSIEILANAVDTLTENCIKGITANKQRCDDLMHASVGIVTALAPIIGYQASANLAKEALKTNVPVKVLAVQKGIMTEEQLNEVLDPYKLTEPPVRK
ncbi:MAG: aspartate ammonia-lyase [Solobacterium sp.]|nr:aspartate ammonia-lyase [Solobacterium sp.]MBQ1356024.1 aspartate ammonia-lyase [Solobacterium sp.]